ncbi:MAG: YbfB/YjiJ family MFS transporter [Burkholderiaceae bacterium]
MLPAMREQLAMDYAAAGWLNTASAIGYLAGAIGTRLLVARTGNKPLFATARACSSRDRGAGDRTGRRDGRWRCGGCWPAWAAQPCSSAVVRCPRHRHRPARPGNDDDRRVFRRWQDRG